MDGWTNGGAGCTSGVFHWVNQDECGSRSAFLAQAHDLISSRRPKEVILLDRCNASAEERSDLLVEMGLCPKDVHVLELHTTPDECAVRISCRTDHPTLQSKA